MPTTTTDTMNLLFGGIYSALIAQDTRILFLINSSDLAARILVELSKRQWFKTQRRVIMVVNDIHSDLKAINATAFQDIVTSAAILNVDPTAFDNKQHDNLFATFKEDFRNRTGAVFNLTDAGAPASYTCGYTMVMGLHRLLRYSNSNAPLEQLATRNQNLFSHMNISLFNATNLPEPSEGNGLRPLPLIDQSGDQVVSTTIVYAFILANDEANDPDATKPIALFRPS
ncbi:hypothetical protein BCR44DRAFT_1278069 [Catenaria anguillulae PL171]|uniref:Uncharacterized protein n=1 Tax=Catenaria anguillulae PL171 TaxID=765915 RepID=A0A1Y2H968_9FUNG|nr:hypothetical protein BCR44DRAFT_1278069 [Catenaria anguillulae PL171]